jgi:1-acyl-sn-glycerol-3-phosphate acyltransferase
VKIIYLLRSLIAIVYFIFITIVLGVFVIVLAIFFGTSPSQQIKTLQDWVIRMWSQSSLWFFGVQLDVHGLENLITENGGLILFNHTSHFDILAIYALIPQSRFGAKIELFSIPIFGRAMRSVGALPIARKNRNEVFRIYKEAQDRFKKGQLFVLSPEGTRQSDEQFLAPFKKGPFIFAKDAGVPLQPIVIQGASKILPKHELIANRNAWISKIQITIFPQVSSKNESVEKLQSQIFEIMQTQLKTTKRLL